MNFTQKMQDAINEQINLEMWSANLYLSMSVHCAQVGMKGFSHWMRMQSREEMEHATDMIEYVIARGGEVKIKAIPAVETEFGNPLSIAEAVYAHECKVSEAIQHMVQVATEEKDMPSQDFFWKYVREQVEEEDNASGLVEQFKLAEGSRGAILFIDRELQSRADNQ